MSFSEAYEDIGLKQGHLDISKREEDKERQLPGIKWITAEELSAGGLSSSVAKVFKLANKFAAAEERSIKKFFKPKP